MHVNIPRRRFASRTTILVADELYQRERHRLMLIHYQEQLIDLDTHVSDARDEVDSALRRLRDAVAVREAAGIEFNELLRICSAVYI